MKKVASGLRKIVLIRKIYMSRKRRVDMMIEESPTMGLMDMCPTHMVNKLTCLLVWLDDKYVSSKLIIN